MKALVVLTSFPEKKDADRMAIKAVESGFAACAQVISGVTSCFIWKGKAHKTREFIVMFKTTSSAWAGLRGYIQKNHPYEVPEVLALPVKTGLGSYLSWLSKSCAVLALFLIFLCVDAAQIFAKDNYVSYKEAQKILSETHVSSESVSAEELLSQRRSDPSLIIYDARSNVDFDRERISGAVLPMTPEYYRQLQLFHQKIVPSAPDTVFYLRLGTESISKDTPIVTYCNRNCGLSKSLMIRLESLGFTRVRYLAGGIDSWREKGYPLEGQNLKN